MFSTRTHSSRPSGEENKNVGKERCIYADACQEWDYYRFGSSGGPLIFLSAPMMQQCGYDQEIMFFYGLWTDSTPNSVQL